MVVYLQYRALGKEADIIFVMGKKGEGKSNAVKVLIKGVSRYIIWDYNHEHSELGFVVTDTATMEEAWNSRITKIVYQPQYKTDLEFTQFINFMFKKNVNNFLLIIEEINNFAESKRIIYPLQVLIRTCRHRGIGMICTSRRALGVHRDVSYNADHILVFKLHHPKDLDLLEEWMDRTKVNQIPQMKKYSFLHFNADTGETEVRSPLPNLSDKRE